jgi:hypothetical protein
MMTSIVCVRLWWLPTLTYAPLSLDLAGRTDKTHDNPWLVWPVCGSIIEPRIDQRVLQKSTDSQGTLSLRKIHRRPCSAGQFKSGDSSESGARIRIRSLSDITFCL